MVIHEMINEFHYTKIISDERKQKLETFFSEKYLHTTFFSYVNILKTNLKIYNVHIYMYTKHKNTNYDNGITNGLLKKKYQFNKNNLYWGPYFPKKII